MSSVRDSSGETRSSPLFHSLHRPQIPLGKMACVSDITERARMDNCIKISAELFVSQFAALFYIFAPVHMWRNKSLLTTFQASPIFLSVCSISSSDAHKKTLTKTRVIRLEDRLCLKYQFTLAYFHNSKHNDAILPSCFTLCLFLYALFFYTRQPSDHS